MRQLLFCNPYVHFQHFIICSIYLWVAITPELLKDIKFKFSGCLSYVGITKCVKFQKPWCTGLKLVFSG